MFKAFALLCIALAIASAQTVTQLTPGTAATGSFPIVASYEEAEFQVQVFSLWIPENVTAASISITDTSASTTSSCYYTVFVSGREIPCGNLWSTETGDWYPCREAEYDYITSTTESLDLYPTSYSEEYYIQLNGYVYITVTRYYSSSYDTLCTFTITATVTSTCGANQVADFDTTTPTCYALNAVNGSSFTGNPTTTSSSDWSMHRIWVPFGVSSIRIMANLTSSTSPDVYFQNRIAPGTGYYFEYTSGSYDSGSGTYIVDHYVYVPQSGYVYIGFTGATITAGSASVMTNVCPSGMGGWNCTYMAMNVTGQSSVNAAISVSNPADQTGFAYTDAFAYIVLQNDQPTLAFINMTFQAATGGSSSYLYYRRDGWIQNDGDVYINSNNYESLSSMVNFALTPADLAIPGVLVIGVSNEGSSGTTISTVVNSTSAAATSASTSAGTTGASSASTQASTTGAASSVAACFALIALCIAALF